MTSTLDVRIVGRDTAHIDGGPTITALTPAELQHNVVDYATHIAAIEHQALTVIITNEITGRTAAFTIEPAAAAPTDTDAESVADPSEASPPAGPGNPDRDTIPTSEAPAPIGEFPPAPVAPRDGPEPAEEPVPALEQSPAQHYSPIRENTPDDPDAHAPDAVAPIEDTRSRSPWRKLVAITRGHPRATTAAAVLLIVAVGAAGGYYYIGQGTPPPRRTAAVSATTPSTATPTTPTGSAAISCPRTDTGPVITGNGPGDTTTGPGIIEKFDYAYYILRDAAAARAMIAPAQRGRLTAAPDFDEAIRALPAGTTHCLRIADAGTTPAGQLYNVLLVEQHPGAQPSYTRQQISVKVPFITGIPVNDTISDPTHQQ